MKVLLSRDDIQARVAEMGKEIARDMEGAHFLFCNDYEFGLISKKTGWSLDQILDHVRTLVITRGKNGADLYSGTDAVHIPTVPEDEVVDPTGVGDAFRGGFLTGYSRGFDWSPVSNRIYFTRDDTSPNDLHWELIDPATGQIAGEGESPYHGDYTIQHPVRVSRDAAWVLIAALEDDAEVRVAPFAAIGFPLAALWPD